jgi:cytochrome c oxidase subunit 3
MSLRAIEAQAQADRAHTNGHGHAVQHLSHQFETLDQQNECYVVGMWTFLVTEIMFFGALFLAYTVYRVLYFPAYLDAHRFLSIPLGTVNTAVLLTSSLVMALGVHAAQQGKRKELMLALTVVILFAFVFLGVKYVEYSKKISEDLFPGPNFNYAVANRMYAEENGGGESTSATAGSQTAGMTANRSAGATQPPPGSLGSDNPAFGRSLPDNPALSDMPLDTPQDALANHAQIFMSLYFAMTGLHAIHIIIGITCMLILMFLTARRHPSVEDYMPTEMVGLYWHFVDIVWIFLFPLMYLIS